MTDRTIAVRLAAIGGDRVRAELREVGTTGERALQRIEQASQPASRALQAVDAAAGEVRGEAEAMAGRLGPAGAALAALGPVGLPSGLLNEVVGVSVQGRRARLWLAFMAEDWGGFIEAPVLLFDGRMDMVEVTDGGRIATIALAAENRLRDLERPRLRRYTSQDQQSDFPGDLGFDFVPELQELEIRWGAPAT